PQRHVLQVADGRAADVQLPPEPARTGRGCPSLSAGHRRHCPSSRASGFLWLRRRRRLPPPLWPALGAALALPLRERPLRALPRGLPAVALASSSSRPAPSSSTS